MFSNNLNKLLFYFSNFSIRLTKKMLFTTILASYNLGLAIVFYY